MATCFWIYIDHILLFNLCSGNLLFKNIYNFPSVLFLNIDKDNHVHTNDVLKIGETHHGQDI